MGYTGKQLLNDVKILSKNNAKSIILLIIFIILFSIISYFIYSKFIKNKYSHILNKEFDYTNTTNSSNKVNLYYFYTEWCPYCKKANPVWDDFCKEIDSKYNNTSYQFNYFKIDCEKNQKMAEKYKVEGYPTIKMEYNKTIYDYNAKPDKNNLLEFVKTVIKE
jgi:thiol-disulfide isomerase/thioredoxin|tara:strand:+ start:1608 stop:2096 length:489 start_codon:yes stop_codon:yes gene_type:complete